MSLYSLEFLDTRVGKKTPKKGEKLGSFFVASYTREHGKNTIEGEVTTKKRFSRNPFEDVKTAVLEILGIIPGKGTMVKITLESDFGKKEIVGIAQEVVKKK